MSGPDSADTLIEKCRRLPLEGEDKEAMEKMCSELHVAVTEVRETTINGEVEGQKIKNMLGAWARLRRKYCEITGEPLV